MINTTMAGNLTTIPKSATRAKASPPRLLDWLSTGAGSSVEVTSGKSRRRSSTWSAGVTGGECRS